jgi:DNA-binding beta-propeller fold protein YncE/predicted GH43/DUF377 family glycosyl hydrolase
VHRHAVIVALISPLLGCLVEQPSPFVGDCAVYPDGVYEYGQIGIGTCLATPSDLRFLERDGTLYLAVSNANAFRDFDSGSVTFIDWSSLDLASQRNLVSELEAHAVVLPHFPGTLAEIPQRELMAVPVRFSADANTREVFDDVHFLDVSQPLDASLASVAADGASSIQVQSDPFPVVYDEGAGLLYVGNRTSHTVSVLDLLASPIETVDAAGRARISGARFFDADGSGSTVAFSSLEIIDRNALDDDNWTLTYIEGSYQIWLPQGQGLKRLRSGGDGSWSSGHYGTELDPADSEGAVRRVESPWYYDSPILGPRMLFASDGTLRGASPADFLADWFFDAEPLLEGIAGAWDESLGGPMALRDDGLTWLFYDGTLDGLSGIGLASSLSGYESFERVSDEPVLVPGGDHDALGQADPMVLYDEQFGSWRMFYSAFDGERWSIGHATADQLDGVWIPSEEPLLALDGDAATPRVIRTHRGFQMWFSRRDGLGDWTVGYAESADGLDWTEGEVGLDYPGRFGRWVDQPPGLALSYQEYDAFRIEGEQSGPTLLHARAGATLESGQFGFGLRLAAGQLLDLSDVGSAGANGVSVSSYVPELGLAYLDLHDAAGTPSIGVARWDGERLAAEPDPLLEAGSAAFEGEGVGSPVVFQDDQGRWVMLYAGYGEGLVRIGRATSDDGLSWTRDGSPVFELGQDWDSFGALPGSIERLDSGEWRLWYSGSNGERSRIGVATSSDGELFEQAREDGGWVLGTGSPGDWDDTSVYHPYAVQTGDALHLWYVGYDGENTRIGHARADDADSLELERDTDPVDDESTVPLLAGSLGSFDYGGLERPVVFQSDDGWGMFYRGLDLGVFRPGLARGPDPTVLYKTPRSPTAGDWLSFSTHQGEGGVNPIDLDGETDGYNHTGIGLAALHLDEQLGMLFVASKLTSYIQVIDVRDDSTEAWDDANYLDIEAFLTTDTASGGAGFRGMVTSSDGTRLYALNDSPEGVFVFDLEQLEDDAWGEAIYDAQIGYLPTPRGGERDQGASTVVSAGPTGLALLPDGETLLVTNFNDNSLSVFDLRMGAYGQLVGEATFLGENPHTVRATPDGRYAVVACYEGDLDEVTVASTLAVVDLDPTSDTWLEVITWIANQ